VGYSPRMPAPKMRHEKQNNKHEEEEEDARDNAI
jgi:hypothetical protein